MAAPKNTSVQGTGPTLIAKGTQTPSRVVSPPSIRSGKINPQQLAQDVENLSTSVNSIHQTLANSAQTIEHFTLVDQNGKTIGILGSEVYQGQYVTNWLQELHIGGTPFAPALSADGSGNLTINNAMITLTTSAGTIVIDPTGPKITISSTAGTITIEAAGPDITITNTANAASLTLQSNPPAMILKDLTGTIVAKIGVDSAGHGTIILNGPVINNPNFGTAFTGTAVVRNAAGTGTSTFVVANGVITSYTP